MGSSGQNHFSYQNECECKSVNRVTSTSYTSTDLYERRGVPDQLNATTPAGYCFSTPQTVRRSYLAAT